MNIHVFVKHVLQVACLTGRPSFWSAVLLITCPSDLLSFWFSHFHQLFRHAEEHVALLATASTSLLRRQKSHEPTGSATCAFSWVFSCRAALSTLSILFERLFFFWLCGCCMLWWHLSSRLLCFSFLSFLLFLASCSFGLCGFSAVGFKYRAGSK